MEYVLIVIAVVNGEPQVHTSPTKNLLAENQCELMGASMVNAFERAKYMCVFAPR